MPKALLLAGLGRYATPDPSATTTLDASSIKAAVASQMQTLHYLGFTYESIDLNPDDVADSVRRLRELLTGKPHWDGVIIGLGLRGKKEYTDLFERVVNMSVEVGGGAVRFGFSTSPTGVVETVGRIFPDERIMVD